MKLLESLARLYFDNPVFIFLTILFSGIAFFITVLTVIESALN